MLSCHSMARHCRELGDKVRLAPHTHTLDKSSYSLSSVRIGIGVVVCREIGRDGQRGYATQRSAVGLCRLGGRAQPIPSPISTPILILSASSSSTRASSSSSCTEIQASRRRRQAKYIRRTGGRRSIRIGSDYTRPICCGFV